MDMKRKSTSSTLSHKGSDRLIVACWSSTHRNSAPCSRLIAYKLHGLPEKHGDIAQQADQTGYAEIVQYLQIAVMSGPRIEAVKLRDHGIGLVIGCRQSHEPIGRVSGAKPRPQPHMLQDGGPDCCSVTERQTLAGYHRDWRQNEVRPGYDLQHCQGIKKNHHDQCGGQIPHGTPHRSRGTHQEQHRHYAEHRGDRRGRTPGFDQANRSNACAQHGLGAPGLTRKPSMSPEDEAERSRASECILRWKHALPCVQQLRFRIMVNSNVRTQQTKNYGSRQQQGHRRPNQFLKSLHIPADSRDCENGGGYHHQTEQTDAGLPAIDRPQ